MTHIPQAPEGTTQEKINWIYRKAMMGWELSTDEILIARWLTAREQVREEIIETHYETLHEVDRDALEQLMEVVFMV